MELWIERGFVGSRELLEGLVEVAGLTAWKRMY